ncbi:hypothetical protein PIB30_013005 [Stylosanthes scabra]|uniref:Uncharacterized protein n=1 Tax=Stylosanthes scabra TaxID=79078 RepID=A0ABU6R6V4_9FABA|nr:hypothetical protein [Stylosanthes scabra]
MARDSGRGQGTVARVRGRLRKNTGIQLNLDPESHPSTCTPTTTTTGTHSTTPPFVATGGLSAGLPQMVMLPTPGSRVQSSETGGAPPVQPDAYASWSFIPRGNDTHFTVVLLVRFGALAEIGVYHSRHHTFQRHKLHHSLLPPHIQMWPMRRPRLRVLLQHILARCFFRTDMTGCWDDVKKGTKEITNVFEEHYKWYAPLFSQAPDEAIEFWWEEWRPVLVFGGFIQFQAMSVMDDVSLQQMMSIHLENMAHVSVVELYVEFEQIPSVIGAVEDVQPDLAFKGYYSESEEEFEGNYEIHDANEEDVLEHHMESDVEDVANTLANELSFQEPSFIRVLDEEALKAPEFAEDMNPCPTFVPGGEFAIGMEFNSRESVIKAMKEYTISRGLDY